MVKGWTVKEKRDKDKTLVELDTEEQVLSNIYYFNKCFEDIFHIKYQLSQQQWRFYQPTSTMTPAQFKMAYKIEEGKEKCSVVKWSVAYCCIG